MEKIQEIGVSSSLNCQFPSTTASNMTTIHTSQEVAEHGIFDWQYYEPMVDDIITPLPFSFARDKKGETLKNKVNPTDIYPKETFYRKLAEYGIKSRVFQRSKYSESTYSRSMLKGADISGYDSLDSGLRDLAECIKNDEGKHYYLLLRPY